MKQHTESQYDDDLTLGSDTYDDSYYSDADDLFEFSTDNESPISRLKSLVLSIDWEITDDVLRQFNEELVDLKSIWAGETINLVYVQALEKISKYIYQNKADSHPSAIKLLLTFYYNLEKVVSSSDLREEQKKEILLEDVKRFENFKRQIKVQPAIPPPVAPVVVPTSTKVKMVVSGDSELLNLKAIVLGIDWEITEQDLNDLRKEVFRLEEKYSQSRPKLILLQGIGTLAAYIKLKKSNSHPDAFKVLQHFYECLEKIVRRPMSLEEEKAVLFPAVEKFNAFKALLGPTIAPEAIVQKAQEGDDDDETVDAASALSPALADVEEEGQAGFQADREALALGLKDPSSVTSHIDHFFGETEVGPVPLAEEVMVEVQEEAIPSVDLFADEGTVRTVDRVVALQGIDVDEDEEEALGLEEGALAATEPLSPVAMAADEPQTYTEVEQVVAKSSELSDDIGAVTTTTEEDIVGVTEAISSESIEETVPPGEASSVLPDRKTALLGVDVETEADDDSDEFSLPMEGEELAPALAAAEEESLFSAKSLEQTSLSGGVAEELSGTMDNIFLIQEVQAPLTVKPAEDLAEEAAPPVSVEEEELSAALDWLDDNVSENTVAEGSLRDQDAKSEDLFTDIDQEDDTTEFSAPREMAETDVLEESSVQAMGADDAVAAFFAEDQTEAEIADDTRDIEDLFDSLETDLASERLENVEGVALEEDVARFFETIEEHAETIPSQVATLTSVTGAGVLAAALAETTLETTAKDKEDEVVFELVADEADDVMVAVEVVDELPESLPVSEEVLAHDLHAVPENIDELQSEFEEVEFEEVEFDEAEFDESMALPIGQPLLQGPLGGLRSCIDSLKLEMSDKILNTLFAEINGLRQRWVDCPLEKTFLQLLSTVTQHIDSYRYESSAEAHGLLVSTCDCLEAVPDNDVKENQEVLLSVMLKVLEWQQGMLSRQAVRVGEQLTFVDPLRAESQVTVDKDAQKDFDALLGQFEQGDGDEEVSPTETGSGQWQESLESSPADDMAVTLHIKKTSLMHDSFADDLKNEIAALRQTLQMEIAELRRELRKED